MTKLKIEDITAMGRVLTDDELREITDRAIVTISCSCTLNIQTKTGENEAKTDKVPAEPIGDFYTKEMCAAACGESCRQWRPSTSPKVEVVQSCTGASYSYTVFGSAGGSSETGSSSSE